MIQKRLQETEHVLLDLEERHRQANATIKEKEFLISNLLKSGRCHHLNNFLLINFPQIILLFWLLCFFHFVLCVFYKENCNIIFFVFMTKFPLLGKN